MRQIYMHLQALDCAIVRGPGLADLRSLFRQYGVRSSVIYFGTRSFRALYVIKSTSNLILNEQSAVIPGLIRAFESILEHICYIPRDSVLSKKFCCYLTNS